jgi:hypothetical protein
MGTWSTKETEGYCIVYVCPRCLNRMWLLDEKLDSLRMCLSDPTIGFPSLDLLCTKCQHVGTCDADLAPRPLRGQEFQDQRDLQVGYWPMRCETADCTPLRQVVVIGSANTTSEKLREALDSAKIPLGFCCSKGHQIVAL